MSWVLILAVASINGGVDTRALGYQTEAKCMEAKRLVDAWRPTNRSVIVESLCLPQWAGPQ